MHAYIIVGTEEDEVKLEVDKLAKNLGYLVYPFPLKTIDDVRDIIAFTNLSLDKKTAICVDGIDKIKEEAGNAFLKAIEEPQENLIFILTATSVSGVLPTILSRCSLIKIKSKETKDLYEPKFFKMTAGERLSHIDKIKSREEALNFLNEIITYSHQALAGAKGDLMSYAKIAKIAMKYHKNINANGNVVIQLTDFCLKFTTVTEAKTNI